MRRTSADIDRVVALIAERSAYWTSQGYVGARLYEQLASDSELPENLDGKVIAAFENKQPAALAQQRKHGRGASFLRLAQNVVIYPRASYFHYLRDRFVERRHTRAQHEYTAAEIENA
jgi:hypothetical protein